MYLLRKMRHFGDGKLPQDVPSRRTIMRVQYCIRRHYIAKILLEQISQGHHLGRVCLFQKECSRQETSLPVEQAGGQL